jgi:hypothetical protein
MPRSFNTAGPCRAQYDYMLPPAERLAKVLCLIEGQQYFVVHGPRRTGKTTALLALAGELTASGRFVSVPVSLAVAGRRSKMTPARPSWPSWVIGARRRAPTCLASSSPRLGRQLRPARGSGRP